jgi:hypothetical protein
MNTGEYNHFYVTRTGFYSSILLTVITVITFGAAMTAIPPSGPYCPGNCMEYPFIDSLAYYPRDYYWMYFAMFQIVTFLIFMISIHFITPTKKKIFSFIGITFSIISSTVLMADYFIQFAVVPISFMKGETGGIALLSQYNGHGIFIALEELGFFLMSLSFLFVASGFSLRIRLERAIRWILTLPVAFTILAFVFYSIKYGTDRSYRFEVAAITINWLTLIIVGILVGIFFHRKHR